MMEKPLSPPPGGLTENTVTWMQAIPNLIPYIQKWEVSVDIASVSAGVVSRQTFSVPGVRSNDSLIIKMPALPAGLEMLASYQALTDQVVLPFWNSSGSPINQGPLAIIVFSIR